MTTKERGVKVFPLVGDGEVRVTSRTTAWSDMTLAICPFTDDLIPVA